MPNRFNNCSTCTLLPSKNLFGHCNQLIYMSAGVHDVPTTCLSQGSDLQGSQDCSATQTAGANLLINDSRNLAGIYRTGPRSGSRYHHEMTFYRSPPDVLCKPCPQKLGAIAKCCTVIRSHINSIHPVRSHQSVLAGRHALLSAHAYF
jgi:hypothetical protein